MTPGGSPILPGSPLEPPHDALPSGIRSAAILGLGLIGGSLARDLAALGVHVLGFDDDTATLLAAREAGAIHHVLDASLAGLAEADVVVLAVPVSAAAAVLASAASHLARVPLITDAGSTKRAVVRAAERLGLGERFVGSHPLAGDHRSGWQASRPGLFVESRVYLCPTSSTLPETLALAEALWRRVGGRTEIVDAAGHDRRLAWTSHLPQVVSTALALALADAGVRSEDLGPGGASMTRLAGSSADLWTGIALENADSLVPAISAMEARLRVLREAMERADPDEVHRLLSRARSW